MKCICNIYKNKTWWIIPGQTTRTRLKAALTLSDNSRTTFKLLITLLRSFSPTMWDEDQEWSTHDNNNLEFKCFWVRSRFQMIFTIVPRFAFSLSFNRSGLLIDTFVISLTTLSLKYWHLRRLLSDSWSRLSCLLEFSYQDSVLSNPIFQNQSNHLLNAWRDWLSTGWYKFLIRNPPNCKYIYGSCRISSQC